MYTILIVTFLMIATPSFAGTEDDVNLPTPKKEYCDCVEFPLTSPAVINSDKKPKEDKNEDSTNPNKSKEKED